MKEAIRNLVVMILTIEAKAILRKYHPRVLLVTGSVGKTSAKDAAYASLSGVFVRKSEKNYNGDIGIPLTVLGVKNGWGNAVQWARNIIDGALLLVLDAPYPAWLIMEVGADRPGDLSRALSWLKPDVVVATRFPPVPVHVEFYDSPESVIREELAPLTWLREGGVAVTNADDGARVALAAGVREISYGLSAGAAVRATQVQTLIEDGVVRGVSFEVSYEGVSQPVTLAGVVGIPHVQAALAGIAAALATGVPLDKAVAGLGSYVPPAGRMHLILGIHKSLLIDDTYNASPAAVEEALATLKDLPTTGRRIAVLADMLELGAYSVGEHERMGTLAAGVVDILVTVGVRAAGIAETLRGLVKEAGPEGEGTVIRQFERGPDAAAFLLTIVKGGDLVLVKGSQSMRMERVTKALMAEPDKAKDLLCRQDPEWLNR